MNGFRSGVKYYTKATVEVFFPENKICCDYCPLLETYARKQCRRTGEYLVDTRTIGYDCPLQFEMEEDNGTDV
jgi:hypothetical protein